MDTVLLNTLLMRCAVFIFGLTFYLALVVVGCAQLRGEPMHNPRLSSRWQFVLFAICGTLCVVVPLLPARDHPSPVEVAREQIAPLLLVVASFACIGYGVWAGREVVKTRAWMRIGRPRAIESGRRGGHPRPKRPVRVTARPLGSGPAPARQAAKAGSRGRHHKRGRHASGRAQAGRGSVRGSR